MILKGSQSGGALKLAAHLLRLDENDHVEVHELRGFSAEDFRGALQEADAVAKGTRCRQFLFALSLNPPETERVSVESFDAAIARVEDRLGLTGQPRAIVFHEKEGRRHAHAVWSRIDVLEMKAINLPFTKLKLRDVSKELFLEHGWRLPDGLRDRSNRNPLNFSREEWQQAKRVKEDPRRLGIVFREAWSVSDNRASFAQALQEQGFVLARGDRRGFVAVDYRGEVYSLSRWTGQKSKALKDRLGNGADLPDVTQAQQMIAARMTEKLKSFIRETEAAAEAKAQALVRQKQEMKERQRAARKDVRARQSERAEQEAQARAARFRKGLGALWDWVSGKSRKIRKRNETEAAAAQKRDVQERAVMIAGQITERRSLQRDLHAGQRDAASERDSLRKEVAVYIGMTSEPSTGDAHTQRNRRGRREDRDFSM